MHVPQASRLETDFFPEEGMSGGQPKIGDRVRAGAGPVARAQCPRLPALYIGTGPALATLKVAPDVAVAGCVAIALLFYKNVLCRRTFCL